MLWNVRSRATPVGHVADRKVAQEGRRDFNIKGDGGCGGGGINPGTLAIAWEQGLYAGVGSRNLFDRELAWVSFANTSHEFTEFCIRSDVFLALSLIYCFENFWRSDVPRAKESSCQLPSKRMSGWND
jgi:hypothetical protein